MFYVQTDIDYEEFKTYRDAEIYCALHGIHCEEIMEEEEGE